MSWYELERDSVTTYYLRKGMKGCSAEAVRGSSRGQRAAKSSPQLAR